MDNALCGGAGATLTGAALASVKAAIFMGDPHNVKGLPYNVGTCQAGGVSYLTSITVPSANQFSSLPVPAGINVLLPTLLSSSLTVTLLIRTAATVTTRTHTNSM